MTKAYNVQYVFPIRFIQDSLNMVSDCEVFVTDESGDRSRPDPSKFLVTIGRDDQIFIVLPLDKPNTKSPTAPLLM